MRVNLSVPYARKDEAKASGARWDAKHKVWYCDPDRLSVDQVQELMRFMPVNALAKHDQRKASRRDSSPPVTITGPRYRHLCDCMPPWDDCEHTAGPELLGAIAKLREVTSSPAH
jgi:hypothetical protein